MFDGVRLLSDDNTAAVRLSLLVTRVMYRANGAGCEIPCQNHPPAVSSFLMVQEITRSSGIILYI